MNDLETEIELNEVYQLKAFNGEGRMCLKVSNTTNRYIIDTPQFVYAIDKLSQDRFYVVLKHDKSKSDVMCYND